MIIKVDQKCIDTGIRKSCYECPVAKAVSKVIPGANIYVGSCIISIVKRGSDYSQINLILPIEVGVFINMFDLGFPVMPFEFELPYE